MTTSSPSFPTRDGQGHGISGWARSLSPRRTGGLVLLLALLLTIANYLLQAKLNYPAVLLDTGSLANAFVAQGEIFALFGFIGLLLCGWLLMVISLGLVSDLEEKRRRSVVVTGGISGVFWAVGALLGLMLVPIWSSATPAVQVLAMLILALTEIGAPLLLTFWTVGLIRQFRAYSVLGWVGALGLLLVVLRSLVWVLNALLPIASGLYGTAGLLAVLAVLGESLWLLWLFLFGFRLMRWNNATVGAALVERTVSTAEGEAKT